MQHRQVAGDDGRQYAVQSRGDAAQRGPRSDTGSGQGELITPFQNYSLTTYHVPGSPYVTTTTRFPDELHVPQSDLSLEAARTLSKVLYGSDTLIALQNGTLSRDNWDRFRYGNMSEEDVRRYILPALEQGSSTTYMNTNNSPYSTQANQAELRYQRAQSSTPVKSGSFSL